MNYLEACEYILGIPKFTSKNRPENIQMLLDVLGNPQECFQVIHVAGTNGKGSVCAFLSSVLIEDGRRVGLFTSPHLVEIRERFQVQGKPVSEEMFLFGFEKVKQAVDLLLEKNACRTEDEQFFHPTFFEWIFAMGVVIFREAEVEYAVLETGLGGRLDATNSVKKPVLTVITSVSLDHTEILGDTVEKIAREKAGIIKDGVPLVCDGRDTAVLEVLEKEAKMHGSQVFSLRPDMYEIFINTDKNIDFSLKSVYDLYDDILVNSPAEYQAVNASLAIMAAEVLFAGERLHRDTILKGIRSTRWPGRMEEVLPDVFLDGGHNAAGVAEFTRTVEKFQKERRITLLFSAVKEKEYEHMIRTICEKIHFERVFVTQVHTPRAAKAEELAELFRAYSERDVVCCVDVKEAFEQALEDKGDGMLFCAGSLYLVGELKELLADRKMTGSGE